MLILNIIFSCSVILGSVTFHFSSFVVVLFCRVKKRDNDRDSDGDGDDDDNDDDGGDDSHDGGGVDGGSFTTDFK